MTIYTADTCHILDPCYSFQTEGQIQVIYSQQQMCDFTLLFSLMRKAIQERAFIRRESPSVVSLPTCHKNIVYTLLEVLMSLRTLISFQFINQNEVPNTKLGSKARVQTFSSHLQAEANDVSNMRDDDGHFTLHELIKYLHGLTGLFLCRHRQIQ